VSIRVLLADDHAIVREGLRALIDKQPDMEIVGEARDGREAIRMAREQVPDVAILDVSMPGLNGVEATRRITRELPDIKVLGLSMHTERQFVGAVIDAGASGYLVKDCALEELIRAVRCVVNGQVYLSPSVAGVVVEGYRAKGHGESAFSALSLREREVLQLIAEGLSTKEIADHLNVSAKTVGTHREHIMTKLEIRSIAGLTKYAIREGVTSIK
jgi:DNA-binding NarL/FixJ family response regulator